MYAIRALTILVLTAISSQLLAAQDTASGTINASFTNGSSISLMFRSGSIPLTGPGGVGIGDNSNNAFLNFGNVDYFSALPADRTATTFRVNATFFVKVSSGGLKKNQAPNYSLQATLQNPPVVGHVWRLNNLLLSNTVPLIVGTTFPYSDDPANNGTLHTLTITFDRTPVSGTGAGPFNNVINFAATAN